VLIPPLVYHDAEAALALQHLPCCDAATIFEGKHAPTTTFAAGEDLKNRRW
jgi:hypothetical protein